MNTPGYLSRARAVVGALGRSRERTPRQRWSRDELLSYQRLRLSELVEHATRTSVFHRRLYGGTIAGEVELSHLPIVTKAAMMSSFDDFVTDPRLTRQGIDAHMAGPASEALHLGEYRLISTSGSTGLRGVFAFSRKEWLDVLGNLFTASAIVAPVRPTLPRPALLAISAPGTKHMSHHLFASTDIGLYRVLRVPATLPLDELVATVGRHMPDQITGYPSVIAMLAEEQLAGRLHIKPRVVFTFGEVRTDEMTACIRAAWGVSPVNGYAITEGGGSVGQECDAHAGMHVLEDGMILESVDAENRPVPPGTMGSKVLLTNLALRTQPLIRYEVTDRIALDDRPCSCGRTSKRIVAIDGRSDDILELPGPDGASIAVHPIHLRSPLGALADLARYQIIQDGPALAVAIVPRRDAVVNGLADAVQRTVEAALRRAGTTDVTVTVRVVDELQRGAGGKLKLVARSALAPITQ